MASSGLMQGISVPGGPGLAGRRPFVPLVLRQKVRLVLRECCGTGLMALGLCLAVALVSFDPGDPSWNVASAGVVHNACGFWGSYVADFLVQVWGGAAFWLVPDFLVLGPGVMHGRVRARDMLACVAQISCLAFAAGTAGASMGWDLSVRLVGLWGVTGAELLARVRPGDIPLPLWHGCWSFLALALFGWISFGLFRPRIRPGYPVLALWFSEISQRVSRTVRRGVFRRGAGGAETLQVSPVSSGYGRPRGEEGEGAPSDPGPQAPESDAAAGRSSLYRKLRSAVGRQDRESSRMAVFASCELPPLSCLSATPVGTSEGRVSLREAREKAVLLETVLKEFGVLGDIVNIRPGPVVTLYELRPAPGTKASRVISLADDIARSMSALSARIASVPGRDVIGIELPNPRRETVFVRDILASSAYETSSAALALILGKDIGGEVVIADLARMPHLLVAGTTGSGKSVAINSMILSLLYRMSPRDCRMIMIDPKMLELSVYDGIPHLLAPVVTDPKKAVMALRWVVREMENRYRVMSHLGVRNITGYNQRVQDAALKGETLKKTVQTGFDPESGRPVFEDQVLKHEPLPYIVVVVDEMADLMLVAGKDIEAAVQRLAQMARAAGIHMIMATQRPSVDVITGTIKANFPTRISFQVSSKIDSRTILNEQGAEQLLGQGDMLYMASGGRVARLHGPFVKDEDVEQVVSFLKTQGYPDYITSLTEDASEEEEGGLAGENGQDDDLYQQAVEAVRRTGRASTSSIQRHLQIGYNRAARLMDRMEEEGVVSAPGPSGKREITG